MALPLSAVEGPSLGQLTVSVTAALAARATRSGSIPSPLLGIRISLGLASDA